MGHSMLELMPPGYARPVVHEVVRKKLFVVQAESNTFESTKPGWKICRITEMIPRSALVHALSSSVRDVNTFIGQMDKMMNCSTDERVVCVGPACQRALTHAVFNLGCYLIYHNRISVKKLVQVFHWAMDDLEPIRDPSWTDPNFVLTVEDYWRALARAQKVGWIAKHSRADNGLWGEIDIRQHKLFDHPSRGHMHVVVPGEILAFGPSNNTATEKHSHYHKDSADSVNPRFSLQVSLFHHLGVSDLVPMSQNLLNTVHESRPNLLVSHDLGHGGFSHPTGAIVRAFTRIVEHAAGLVAVECGTEGCTLNGSTLIGLHLMRKYSFSVRSAISWIHLLRPGSVRGEQPDYLLAVEKCFCTLKRTQRTAPTAQYTLETKSSVPAPESCYSNSGHQIASAQMSHRSQLCKSGEVSLLRRKLSIIEEDENDT